LALDQLYQIIECKKKKALSNYRLSRLPFNNKSFDWYKKDICSLRTATDWLYIHFVVYIELFMVYSREIRIYPLQKSSLEPYEQMIDLLFIPKKQYW